MIEIACIAEGPYVRHAGAMLHSALSHCTPGSARVHLLHAPEFAAGDRAHFETLASTFDAPLQFWNIGADALHGFAAGYFPRSVWYRALLPKLLIDTEKVLYLDADLIVCDAIEPLWHTDLGDALLGAVVNPLYPFMRPHFRTKLGIERPEDYFNSGVLLLNLTQMRSADTAERLREFAIAHPGADYPDQDALNVVCRGRWLALPPRWNAQSTFFELPARQLPIAAPLLHAAINRPGIVHFIGPFKPWHFLCRHPLRGRYFEHARQTPWGRPALEGRSLRNLLLRQLPLRWIDRWFRLERNLARRWRRWLSHPLAGVGR